MVKSHKRELLVYIQRDNALPNLLRLLFYQAYIILYYIIYNMVTYQKLNCPLFSIKKHLKYTEHPTTHCTLLHKYMGYVHPATFKKSYITLHLLNKKANPRAILHLQTLTLVINILQQSNTNK